MATVNLGRIKPVFRGAYNNSTAYVIDDIVTSGNETFIAIAATQGNATSDASKWTKLAAKGVDGTDISTTLTTQGDLLYRNGSGLQRLGAGTNGQLLQTGGSGANPSWTDAPSGVIKKVHHFTNNTRTAQSGSVGTVLTMVQNYNGFLDLTNNSLHVLFSGYGKEPGNDVVALGLRFEGNTSGTVDTEGKGVGYSAMSGGSLTSTPYWMSFNLAAGSLSSLSGNIDIYLRNYDSGSSVTININSSDDARLNQTESHLIIYEYKNN